MNFRNTFLVFVTFAFWPLSLLSSSGLFAGNMAKPQTQRILQAAKINGEIILDGELNDTGWKEAARAEGFIEHQPGYEVAPPVNTVALLTYDESNLYAAFICEDDPSQVRASISERENITGDDNVVLIIDTYGDATFAYLFFVNAKGIQMDRLWSANSGEDTRYDFIWYAESKITDSGYQVEICVPFSTLRFPDTEEQKWKIDFWRNRPRDFYCQYSWSPYDLDNPCWPCQWNLVTGIENVKPGKGLSIVPSIVTYQASQIENYAYPDACLNHQEIDGELSLNTKLAISSAITAEATINPDFSQVEADVAQIDVNTTFALFYTEKRPFFQEGGDLFEGPFTAVYTRVINDPIAAVKVTGRPGRLSLAYLFARDEKSPITLPFEENSIYLLSGRSTSNMFRIRRSIGASSYIGLLTTDRRFDKGGSGSLWALDGRIYLSRSIYLNWQTLASLTREPEDEGLSELAEMQSYNIEFYDGKHTVALDGENFMGHGIYLEAANETKRLTSRFQYEERSPTFRADNGFETGNNQRKGSGELAYRFYPDKSVFHSIESKISANRDWNFQGTAKSDELLVELNSYIKFAQSRCITNLTIGSQRFREIDFNDLWLYQFTWQSRFSNRLLVAVKIGTGDVIAYSHLVKGRETAYTLTAHLRLTPSLRIEPYYRFSKATDPDAENTLYRGYIFRLYSNYQFTREFSFRLITQYNDFYETWEVDPLITYRLNAFSALYAGATYDYDNIFYDEPHGQHWKLGKRQFFLKVQYMFQT